MAKDKVITVMCAARLPEMLVKRIDSAAASGGVSRAQFIAEACRMRLDGPIIGKVVSVGTVQPPDSLPPLPYYQGESTEYPGLERSGVPMQALRDICAGKTNGQLLAAVIHATPEVEIPICGKTWWEDGEQYECLMDKGHKEQKHGMRDMVRRLDP